MTDDPLNLPASRTWRDIPQPIRPRAMSRGGRWRLAAAGLRTAMAAGVVAGVVWGGWKVVAVLQEDSRMMPAAAKAVPLKTPELSTTGVLSRDWLVRTLALPRNVSLMEVDLERLRARILADPQVLTATLTRHFPDRLIVDITEREPIARLMAEWRGTQMSLLVARDGVVFAGEGHDPGMMAMLPWLHGVKLVRSGDRFLPIQGMDTAADFLATTHLHAPWLYEKWHVVSLARLGSDREIEVKTNDGITVIFSTGADFFRQLVKLDFLLTEFAARGTPAQGRIDLSLGAAVPVMLEATVAAEQGTNATRSPANRPATTRPTASVRTLLSTQLHREF